MKPNDQETAIPPIAVGRYFNADGKRVAFPYSAMEIERARRAAVRVLSTFHFRPGSNVLFTSLYDEGAHLLGTERAIMSYGMVSVNADASPYDASRVESILRRFELVAVLAVSNDTLDGLARLGHDPEKCLAGKVVWARPQAYRRLAGKPGLEVYRWHELGPAVGMECQAGAGAHIDRFEWYAENRNGEIVVTSLLERSVSFNAHRTGVRGHVTHDACKCGNPDPRLIVD